MYKLIKILNNNAVLVEEADSQSEVILLGKGIGFKKEFTERDFNKLFRLANDTTKHEYLELFTTINPEIINITDDLMKRATVILGELQPSSFHVICGHLDFAFRRFQEGRHLENVLLDQIITLYPSEFAVASEVRLMMRDRLGVEIDLDEIGFIALHLNASRLYQNVKESLRTANTAKKIVDLTCQLDLKPASDAVLSQRTNYISMLLKRLMAGEPTVNLLSPALLSHFEDELSLARQIATVLKQELALTIGEPELGYLALHLHQYAQAK